jgi:hypothetical protein
LWFSLKDINERCSEGIKKGASGASFTMYRAFLQARYFRPQDLDEKIKRSSERKDQITSR